MITMQEGNMLERILKTGLHIIFQNEYGSFNNALRLGNLKSLQERRIVQLARFSKKAYKSDRFKSWFCESEEPHEIQRNTRNPVGIPPLVKPVPCRTQRYARSSLPLMTRLLSWHPPLRYTPIDLA